MAGVTTALSSVAAPVLTGLGAIDAVIESETGGPEHGAFVELLLCGAGVPTEKSDPFWSVSVQGTVRMSASVVEGAGANVVPS